MYGARKQCGSRFLGRVNEKYMKKDILRFLILVFTGLQCSFGQSIPIKETKPYLSIPQENIYIHHNASLLFVGEYLYYKVYNLHAKTATPSKISKIAYVTLVGEREQIVFEHKVHLEKGEGQGDVFIPVNTPSGNYKLIAYTQWMRNRDKDYFFQDDISIINPYQTDQKEILAITDEVVRSNPLPGPLRSRISESDMTGFANGQRIKLTLDAPIFKKRAKVALKLETSPNLYSEGNYSLSVRKMDTMETSRRLTSQAFIKSRNLKDTRSKLSPSGTIFPPELRGELISGRVVATDTRAALEEVEVAISIPGNEGNILKMVSTNEEGFFYVSLEKEYDGDRALIQVLGEAREKYKVELLENKPVDYSGLEFYRLQITPEMDSMIIERSVHNQIENSYFDIKPDSLDQPPAITPLYYDLMEVYDLDDYTRFSTVDETLVEVIEHVWSRRTEKGNRVLQVREYEHDFYTNRDFLPLIVVDGILVQNHDNLLRFNARDVKRISILRNKYILGSRIFQGVVHVETIDKNYPITDQGDHIIGSDLFKPLPRKRYFQLNYEEQTSLNVDRLLDFRYQLLWVPKLGLDQKERTISFYTSDIPGEYEVCLEGFTREGKPVSLKTTFMVE